MCVCVCAQRVYNLYAYIYMYMVICNTDFTNNPRWDFKARQKPYWNPHIHPYSWSGFWTEYIHIVQQLISLLLGVSGCLASFWLLVWVTCSNDVWWNSKYHQQRKNIIIPSTWRYYWRTSGLFQSHVDRLSAKRSKRLMEFVLYYHWPNSSSLFDTISFCGLKVTVFV